MEVNSIIDPNKIKKEAEVHPGGTTDTDQFLDLLNKTKEGICRIVFKNKGYGTGFFCKFEDPIKEEKIIKVLFTCNHVLKEEYINENKQITLEFKKLEKNLDLKNRRIWFNSKLDYTCIEIFKNDNIKYFFNIDENITNFNYSIENYEEKGIYIFGIMKNLQLGFDSGYITKVKEPHILYNCNTNPGCSGGAIIEKISSSIIGIHTGSYDNKKYNIGIFIKSVIEDIKNNKFYKILENEENENEQKIKKKEYKKKVTEKVANYKKELNMEICDDCLFKIIFIGNYNSKKSMLMSKFIEDCPNDTISIGYDFRVKTIKINNKIAKFQMWVTSGQEGFKVIPSIYRGASCIIIVYNIRDRETFDHLKYWIIDVNNNCLSNITKILIGNDFPLEDLGENEKREVSYSEGKDFALKNNLTFYEVSLNTDFDELLKEITKEIIGKSPKEKNTKIELNPDNNTNSKNQACLIF